MADFKSQISKTIAARKFKFYMCTIHFFFNSLDKKITINVSPPYTFKAKLYRQLKKFLRKSNKKMLQCIFNHSEDNNTE